MIRFENVSFGFGNGAEEGPIFDGLSLRIGKGEYLAVVGPNGSGKTTLAMLVKGILSPSSGRIFYGGEDVTERGINGKVGYLFSNPENQIVSSVVEEDVAFGPENRGLGTDDIRSAVNRGLEVAGVTHLRRGLTHLLSGGELQKVLISGIVSMDIDCIAFDEASSMLDPAGRREVVELLRKMNADEGITIIHITHSMEELLAADRVVALKEGAVVFEGASGELFEDGELLESVGLKPDGVSTLIQALKGGGVISGCNIRGVESLADAVCAFGKRGKKKAGICKPA